MAGQIQERDVAQHIQQFQVDITSAGSGRPKREGSFDFIRTPDFQNALETNLGKLAVGLLEKENFPFEIQKLLLPVERRQGRDGTWQLSSAVVTFDGRDPQVREEYEKARQSYSRAQSENIQAKQEIKNLEKSLWFRPNSTRTNLFGTERTREENRANLERLARLYGVIDRTQTIQTEAAEGLSASLFTGDLDIFTRPLTPEDLGILVNQGKFSKYEGPLYTIQKHFESNHPSGGSKPPEPPEEGDGSERPAWGPSTYKVQYAAVGSGVILVVGGVAIGCVANQTATAQAAEPDGSVGSPPINEPTPTAVGTVNPTEVPIFQPKIIVDGVEIEWRKYPEIDPTIDSAYQFMLDNLVNKDFILPYGSSLESRPSHFVLNQAEVKEDGQKLTLEMYAQKVDGLKDESGKPRDDIYLISIPVGKDTRGNDQWKYQLAKWGPTANHQGNGGFEEYQLVYIGADLKETADRFFFVSRNPGEKNFILSFNGHEEGNLGPIIWQAGGEVDIAGFFSHLLGTDGLPSPRLAPTATATFTATNTRRRNSPTPSATPTPREILTATIQAINTAKATDTATSTATKPPPKEVPATNTPKPSDTAIAAATRKPTERPTSVATLTATEGFHNIKETLSASLKITEAPPLPLVDGDGNEVGLVVTQGPYALRTDYPGVDILSLLSTGLSEINTWDPSFWDDAAKEGIFAIANSRAVFDTWPSIGSSWNFINSQGGIDNPKVSHLLSKNGLGVILLNNTISFDPNTSVFVEDRFDLEMVARILHERFNLRYARGGKNFVEVQNGSFKDANEWVDNHIADLNQARIVKKLLILFHGQGIK